MRFEELERKIWRKYTLKEKLQSFWYRLCWGIQDRWWLISGTCPHEATIRPAGKRDKDSVCILCGKKVKI